MGSKMVFKGSPPPTLDTSCWLIKTGFARAGPFGTNAIQMGAVGCPGAQLDPFGHLFGNLWAPRRHPFAHYFPTLFVGAAFYENGCLGEGTKRMSAAWVVHSGCDKNNCCPRESVFPQVYLYF